MMKRTIINVIALVALCVGLASAGPNDPIVGEELASMVSLRGISEMGPALQAHVPLPDSSGYTLLTLHRVASATNKLAFAQERIAQIICSDIEHLLKAVQAVKVAWVPPFNEPYAERTPRAPRFDDVHVHLECNDLISLPIRGIYCDPHVRYMHQKVLITTVHQTRFVIWYDMWYPEYTADTVATFSSYALAVSDYLYSLDTGWMEAPAPKAVDYSLPDSLDFYAPPPDYVIDGYDNYLNFLNAHDTIRADFAYGLTEFTPSDSLWEAMIETAPRAAWPNKEWPVLQHEYREFFERGGDVRCMQTLTREGFDTLSAGEYFFAVSIAGKIRFGREVSRSDVQRIVAQTGQKIPRANHAFLFPGEPVLTAGAFFIEDTSSSNDSTKDHRLSHINAHSGHYFYSNLSETIREDIAVRSDEYLLTLGHFFKMLDSLGIPHESVVVSKL
jgi:hypothetical protein